MEIGAEGTPQWDLESVHVALYLSAVLDPSVCVGQLLDFDFLFSRYHEY